MHSKEICMNISLMAFPVTSEGLRLQLLQPQSRIYLLKDSSFIIKMLVQITSVPLNAVLLTPSLLFYHVHCQW